jgi:hypothetical protein
LISEALATCGVGDTKPGALPAGFMVYFVLALALFQQDSYDDVAEHMVGSIPQLRNDIPNKSSFARARQRLGPQVLETVFRALAGPLAPDGLEGSFYCGMRIAAVDGFLLDAPETEANRHHLGGSKDAKGQPAGFPQARVVTLTETGTHAQIDAAVGEFRCREPELAIRLVASAAGMLVIMDRGFPGVALWRTYTGAGAHLLIRARSCVAARPIEYLPDGTYLARMNLAGQKRAAPGHVVLRVVEYRVDGGEVIRLLTDLLDPDDYPAAELARLYSERWEAESSYREIKTFQRGPQQVLRSAERALVGLKGYVTNVEAVVMPAAEVMAKYHELWQVERSFRMSKTDLAARPMFHRTRDAIEAHLTIVFTALAVARQVQALTSLAIGNVVKQLRPLRSATITINGVTQTFPPEVPPAQMAILDRLNRPEQGH